MTIGVMMAGGGVITGGVPIGGAGVIGMSLSGLHASRTALQDACVCPVHVAIY